MTTSEDMFVQANKEHESGRTKKAYKLFVSAARAGHPYAPNSVGYFLDNGIGVAQNKKKAIHWYRKAARKGDICAIQNLGIVYRDLRNLRRAIFWLTRAVAAGDGDAALELAKIHLAREKTSRRKRGEAYLRTAVGSKSVTQSSREEAALLLRRKNRAISRPRLRIK